MQLIKLNYIFIIFSMQTIKLSKPNIFILLKQNKIPHYKYDMFI